MADLSGLEKPLLKLIEVCSNGVGPVARPWLMKDDANALAEANDILNRSALALTEESFPTRASQIEHRVAQTEVRRQRNLLQITRYAQEALPEEVPNESVDEDWTTRFFSSAQDVSNAQMQELWGKVLSAEVSRPGSFSMKALDILRSMGQKEAEAFQRLCQFVLDDKLFIDLDPLPVFGKDNRIGQDRQTKIKNIKVGIEPDNFEDFYATHGVDRVAISSLQDIGLIAHEPILGLGFVSEKKEEAEEPLVSEKEAEEPLVSEKKEEEPLVSEKEESFVVQISTRDHIMTFQGWKEPWHLKVSARGLTTAGQQLAKVVPVDEPSSLFQKFKEAIANSGLTMTTADKDPQGESETAS